MTNSIAWTLSGIDQTGKKDRASGGIADTASYRRAIAGIDTQLWAATGAMVAGLLPTVLLYGDQQESVAAAFGGAAVFSLILLAARVRWRSRLWKQWESAMQALVVRGDWV